MPYPEGIPEATYSGINLYLWIGAIILHIIATFIIGLKATKIKDVPSLQNLLYGYSFFNFVMAINRFFFLWAYLTPSWNNYNNFLSIGYFCSAISYAPIIFILEKYLVQKTKFIFSVVAFIIVILSLVPLFLPENLLTIRSTLQLLGFGSSILWFFLYIYIIINSTGAPRRKAINIVLAVIIAILGFTFDSEMIISMQVFPLFVAPSLYCAGICLLMITLVSE